MMPFEILPARLGGLPVLFVCDHAANHVPSDIDLGLAPALLNDHIAIDIGAAALTRALADATGASAFLATISRLVVDTNRPLDSAGLIPRTSDGHAIPGNLALNRIQRGQRLAWHAEYHAALSRMIESERPDLLVSVHSFTPVLATDPHVSRPWPVAILYNQDDRAARVALDHLRGQGLDPGDNEPYSGRVLNYTMDRHAEARGLPYIGFEVRQDELTARGGIDRWADRLAPCVRTVLESLVLRGVR
jgi:predicted N-formylglutamate amidohydrolase